MHADIEMDYLPSMMTKNNKAVQYLMTVSGFTKTRIDFQSCHISESQAKNSLSLSLSFRAFDRSLLAKSQILDDQFASADKQTA
jgi:hypothetical protein